MEYLTKWNIKVQPLTRSNLNQALIVINQAFLDNPIIINGIQTFEQLAHNTKILMEKVLDAQQKINKINQKPFPYCVIYYLNDQILCVGMMCDLNLFLEIVNNGKSDILTEPFKHLDIKQVEMKKYVYLGKSVIASKFRSLGLAKYLIFQRLEYFYKYGYQYFYVINSNKLSNRVWNVFGADVINDSKYKLPNGRELDLTLMKCNLGKIFKTKQVTPKL